MGIIGSIFLVLFAITAVLIIAIVMLQDEQGEGFGGLFGGGSSTPFGATGGNILTRITSVLGVFFMVSSLAVAMAYKSGEKDDVIGEARRAEESGPNWFMEQPAEELPVEMNLREEDVPGEAAPADTADEAAPAEINLSTEADPAETADEVLQGE
ncbi:MAG: preprotein translocase subunit SecG [Spirochaeta sp. LUC14_002_19_P3]|nr:MAG: preprotein translocase subunit SecG [Spirochaeta sp. LUC14_002_19_P3]